jgi:hypothetical protein
VWAEEALRERGGSLDPEALYDLVLQATGDRAKADAARAKAQLEVLRRGGKLD